jgi:tripartite-type tricarboxylate transporter receptor subunit TctC
MSASGSSLQDLVNQAKANPAVFFASSGAGSASHLSGELFMGLTQTKLTHVPYKGMGQAVQDLVGGQVTVMFGPPPVLLPQVKAGKLKALAVASPQRSPLFADIPTAAEAGVAGFDAGAWYGLLVRAGTSQAVITKISEETARAVKKAEVVQVLASIGATPVGSTPEEFARYLTADIAKWDDLLKKAGVAQK